MVKIASTGLSKWAFVGFGVITAIHAATSIGLPFGWDQGIMAAVGSSYAHGGLPYADSWDMKGPISYVPYALAEILFGPTTWGVRIFDVILAALGSFVLFRGVRALTTWRIGAWAAFALYYWTAASGWFFTAAPEPWTGLLCLMAVVPLLASRMAPSIGLVALSGLLIGMVGLVKPHYLAVGVAPLLFVLLAPDLTLRRRVELAFALAGGALAPIVIACGYFTWRGGLAQAVEVHVLYPLSTYASVRTGGTTAIDGFAAFFARPTVALLSPFVVLGVWSFRNRPHILWPALGWLAALVLSVGLQGKYFPAHWMPVYAPLVFLAALGAPALFHAEAKGGAHLIVGAVAAVMFAAQVCAPPFHDAAKSIYYLALKRSPERYYASFQEYIYNAQDEQAAARYIAAHSDADDGVFVWGNDATVRYLADRPNPTRFTFEMPLSLPGSYLARYRAEAMRDLRARPPTYFIVGVNWWGSDTQDESLAKFPELAAFLRQGYRPEKSFGVLRLYRRSAPVHP